MGIKFLSRVRRDASETVCRESAQSESGPFAPDKKSAPGDAGDGENDKGVFPVALLLLLLVLAYGVLAEPPVLEAHPQLQVASSSFASHPLNAIFNRH